jgi:hypothetical protein
MIYLLKYLLFGGYVDKDGNKESFLEGYTRCWMRTVWIMAFGIAFLLLIFIGDQVKIFLHWLSML